MQPETTGKHEPTRIADIYHRATRLLVERHAQREDEPLVLAIRFRVSDLRDIYLLEVIANFPGEDTDELFSVELGPTEELPILGRLHLFLASPAQMLAAIERKEPIIAKLRKGVVLYCESSALQAEHILHRLGLSSEGPKP